MFVTPSDHDFVFVVIRGDKQVSERKLRDLMGPLEPAGPREIANAGAVAGYASPIGLKDAVVVVDAQIPGSANLVAGANETGFHFLNVNYGRDYKAALVADLTRANPGDPCPELRNGLIGDQRLQPGRPRRLSIQEHHARGGRPMP